MKIIGLFLNNELRTGGHTRYLELMEGLASRGNDVTVIMNEYLPWEAKRFKQIRIPLLYVKGKKRFLGKAFKNALADFSLEQFSEADWIIVFGETHWGAARYLSTKLSIPICFAFRSDAIEECLAYIRYDKPSCVRKVALILEIAYERLREKVIARKAKIIVFQSPHDLQHYCTRNPEGRVRSVVIRGDLRQSRFKPELAQKNASTSCRNLLFAGTLGKRKGLVYVLRAIALLPAELQHSIHLDIIAAGQDFDPFQKLIDDFNIGDYVSFHGKVTTPLSYMVKSDLLVVPSLFDSYPNVILEALHVGLPVIGSKVGGIPDMLVHDSLLFEPASPESLAKAIAHLVSSDDAYQKASVLCAGRRSHFDFDWAAEWEKYLVQGNCR